MSEHHETKKHSWKHSKSKTAMVSFVVSTVLIATAIGLTYAKNFLTLRFPSFSGPASTPERLLIPAIKVNAIVQKVGLDSAGRMGIPTNFTDVAWYQNGPNPGEKGSAVIDGHLDTALSADAVFANLNLLRPGDDIYVIDKNNQKIHFKVTSSEIYDDDKAPLEKIFDQTVSGSRLNLITCDGVWNPKTKNYSERLVVYSERVK